jgi:uncharacterized protein YecT (DUF1311 family)
MANYRAASGSRAVFKGLNLSLLAILLNPIFLFAQEASKPNSPPEKVIAQASRTAGRTPGLSSFSVLSRADDSDGSPQWCTKAKTKVEKLICEEDGQLGEYDQELSSYYETLVKMVEPSTKSDLVQSQKRWIAEREQCGATAKKVEDLVSCVYTKNNQRSDLLLKDIAERNIEKRVSEFNKFKLRAFKDTAFEFQYPSSWHLETTEDGRISLKSQGEDMILGFEKTVTSSKQCTYSEGGISEDEIRRDFYAGKKHIGGQEFDKFNRGWIPSGEDEHYYWFFNGHCFVINVYDNSARSNCYRIYVGKGRAICVIAELEAKDLMAYSEGVFRTLRFSSDQN